MWCRTEQSALSSGVWWQLWNSSLSPVFFTASGRGGFLVNDKILVYVEAGIWRYFTIPSLSLIAGAGVEVAPINSLSVFGEAKLFYDIVAGLLPGVWLQVGLNWHFGN